uniref:POLR2D protein n=1 Tax=Homo sapiens TaxID=9606 RepID=Q96FU3_HUMAN|nr:POLR2D protein [Homo sapiens]
MKQARTEHLHPNVDLQVLPHDLHQSPYKERSC